MSTKGRCEMAGLDPINPDAMVFKEKPREGGGAKGALYDLVPGNGVTVVQLWRTYLSEYLPEGKFERWLREMAKQGYVQVVPPGEKRRHYKRAVRPGGPKLTLVPKITEVPPTTE